MSVALGKNLTNLTKNLGSLKKYLLHSFLKEILLDNCLVSCMYVMALCSTEIPVFSKHGEMLHSTFLPLSVLSYLLITINKAGGCLASPTPSLFWQSLSLSMVPPGNHSTTLK